MKTEVKETGIIMSGNHPRLILDGLKSMTRRTYGLEEINEHPDHWKYVSTNNGLYVFMHDDGTWVSIKCPYGQVGDLLRVKETWAICSFSANFAETSQLQIAYRAGRTVANPHPDGMTHSLEWRTVDYETWQKYACQKYYSWQPSLFMPKAFARIWRPITAVRAERLQEITNEDAKAEGVTPMSCCLPGAYHYITPFKELWDSLNAKRGYGWDFNPWVWPITFGDIGVSRV